MNFKGTRDDREVLRKGMGKEDVDDVQYWPCDRVIKFDHDFRRILFKQLNINIIGRV